MKKVTRFFSFVLVFALVLGIVPFSAGAAGEALTIDFTKRSDTWLNPISSLADDMRYIPKNHTDGNWSFFEYTPGMWVSQTSFRQFKDDYFQAGLVEVGNWFALKADLTEGNYTTQLNYYYWTKAGAADIYLLPGDTTVAGIPDAIADDTYKIGDVDCYGGGWVKTSKALNNITIPETGEYIIVFKLTKTTEAIHLYLRQLILEPADTGSLQQVEAICAPSSVKAGRKSQIRVSGTLEDGTAADLSKAQITYTALDPEIATVSNTGVITTLSPGEADFGVSVTLGGAAVTDECTLSVLAGEPDSKAAAKVKFNFNYIKENWVSPISGSNLDIRDIPYEMTDGTWAYYGYSPGLTPGPSTFRVYRNQYFEPALPEVGNWMALKIKLPAAGIYTATLNYYEYSNSGAADIFIVPIDTQDVSDSVKNEFYKIGEVDCYGPEWIEKSTSLDDVYIPEAGEYLLVFKGTNIDHGIYLWIKNLILDGLEPDQLWLVDAAITPDTVWIGEQAVVSVNGGTLANEMPANLANAEISYESSDTGIAVVDENGVVTGVSGGTAGIIVSVTLDGITATETCEINVNALDGIAVTTPPVKTAYVIGESFDPAGMVVTASYTAAAEAPAEGYTYAPTDVFEEAGIYKIEISYTEREITKTAHLFVTVNPVTEVIADDGKVLATATDAASEATIDGAITGDAPGFEQGSVNRYVPGTTITLTAGDVNGKMFRYWKHVTSGRIIGTSKSLSFKVGSDTQVTAVYSEPAAGKYLIEFIDKNGKVLQSEYLDKNAAIVAPENPYSVGYTFTGWNTAVPATATRNQAFIAQYAAKPAAYTLEVEGPANVVGGNESPYAYNAEIRVEVDSAAIPEGMKFAYWRRDGKTISYDTSYSFYMWDHTIVEAVCVDNASPVIITPHVIMDRTRIEGGRIIFASERTVPAAFEIIETGILLKQGEGDAESLKLGGDFVAQIVSLSVNPRGQFTVRKDAAVGSWYARAYVIYKDGADIKVVYSNIERGSAEK